MGNIPPTIVRYRWNDSEPWQRVAVETETATVQATPEKMPIDCPNKLFNVTVAIASTLESGVCKPGPHIYNATVYAPWGVPETYSDFGAWAVRIPQYYPDGSFRRNTPVGRHCRVSEAKPNPVIIDARISSTGDNCTASGCRFKVFDATGKLVFQEVKQGECPEWEIEGGCPPETIECGDCCLDCGEYLGDVRSLVSMVKQLNESPVTNQ